MGTGSSSYRHVQLGPYVTNTADTVIQVDQAT